MKTNFHNKSSRSYRDDREHLKKHGSNKLCNRQP